MGLFGKRESSGSHTDGLDFSLTEFLVYFCGEDGSSLVKAGLMRGAAALRGIVFRN